MSNESLNNNKIPADVVQDRLRQEIATEQGLANIKKFVESTEDDVDNDLTLATGWTKAEMQAVAREILEEGAANEEKVAS